MSGKLYGYMRVSTKEQHEDRQRIALINFGVEESHIYLDKQSGKDFNRPSYKKLLKTLKSGDTLAVLSIDRLGRNYAEIIDQWKLITEVKEVAIAVIDMPLLNTKFEKDLTGRLISDIVLQLLSYVAQTEREFIRKRQAEGIAIAKANGVKFGAKPKEKPVHYETVLSLWKNGNISAREAARRLSISHNTFLRWSKE